MDELKELMKILNLSSMPDKISKDFAYEGVTGHLEKDKNYLRLSLKVDNQKEEFDDSEIKQIISEYKEHLKALDDDLFIEVMGLLKPKMDLQKFNDLLDLKTFTQKQAEEVEEMIDFSTEVICSTIQSKVQKLIDLYENF